MGSRGGTSPNGFPQRKVSALFLRVPIDDWNMVKTGLRTEFRTMPHERVRVTHVNVPTVVVAYATRGTRRETDARTMMLEDRRFEPVFAIAKDDEAIARAGYDSYAEFRRDWRVRHHGRYAPMTMVYVWRLRPMTVKDVRLEGVRLLTHLYGEWLDVGLPG